MVGVTVSVDVNSSASIGVIFIVLAVVRVAGKVLVAAVLRD